MHFKEHNVDVAVSVDGTIEHHDAARITNNAKGTYEQVISNLRKYQSCGISTNISATIGKHNVYDLPKIAAYFLDEHIHERFR